MTISMQSAKSSSFASEQVQAFFLAQEGLELAEKARDDLLLRASSLMVILQSYLSWGTFYMNSGPYGDCFR